MFSGLGNIMGSPTGQSSAQGLANVYSPYQQQAGLNQMNATTQQQQIANLGRLQQQFHARQAEPPPRWMVDGQSMSFQEFVHAVFPEHTPERTFFLLKYSK
jgi:hypothetical protein